MPRGDKDWIMNYPIAIPDEKTMIKSSSVVGSIKQKMKICKNTVPHLTELSDLILSKMTKVEIPNVLVDTFN
jgi:hypothetical protein